MSRCHDVHQSVPPLPPSLRHALLETLSIGAGRLASVDAVAAMHALPLPLPLCALLLTTSTFCVLVGATGGAPPT